MSLRSCAVCGASSGSRKYCSRTCKNRAYHQGYRERHGGAWQSTVYRRKHGRRPSSKSEITCQHCGNSALVTKRTARFCSNRCYQDHKLSLRSKPSTDLVHVGPLPRPTWSLVESSSGRLWVAGRCRRCGSSFVIVDQVANVYCSRRCSRADGKDRRRALTRGSAPVYRRRIFERDGWRCQLCGRKVNRAAKAPHPKAPTLDHIVPVAAGGVHAPENVQCAHFLCNAEKNSGVFGAGEQLRLVG